MGFDSQKLSKTRRPRSAVGDDTPAVGLVIGIGFSTKKGSLKNFGSSLFCVGSGPRERGDSEQILNRRAQRSQRKGLSLKNHFVLTCWLTIVSSLSSRQSRRSFQF